MLEEVQPHDLWMQLTFFGTTGSNNVMNVLNTFNILINMTTYTIRYYLAIDIYID